MAGSLLQRVPAVLLDGCLGPDFMITCFIFFKAGVIEVWEDIHCWRLGIAVDEMQVIMVAIFQEKERVNNQKEINS